MEYSMKNRCLSLQAGCIVVVICLGLNVGCYHYRALVPQAAGPPATEPKSEVVWSFIWGLVQENPRIDNCQGQPLAEVHVTSNFGFALLTVATLGLAAPVRVEWRCAKAQPRPGVLRVPTDPAPGR